MITTGIGLRDVAGSVAGSIADTCNPPVDDPKLDPEVVVRELVLEASRYPGNALELGRSKNVN